MNSSKDIIEAYDRRAANYDASFHAEFAQEVVDSLDLREGQSVLDICCGTGLVSRAAKEKVQQKGKVVGIDFSPASLAVARVKSQVAIEFLEYDCSVLGTATLAGVPYDGFDHVTVCSALVLFQKPYEPLVASWIKFLKPGGSFTVDVPGAGTNWVSDLFIESLVSVGLQTPSLSNTWIKSHDSLRTILEGAGLTDVDVFDSKKYNRVAHDAHESDALFDKQLESEMWRGLKNNENAAKLQSAREYYARALSDLSARQNTPGKFESATMLYIGKGRKP